MLKLFMAAIAAAILVLSPANAGPLEDRWWQGTNEGFLVLPRAMMNDMPDDWQTRMADLLDEWDEKNGLGLGALGITPMVSARSQFTNRFVVMPRVVFEGWGD